MDEKESDRGSIIDKSNNKKIYKYNKNLEIVEKTLISIFSKNPKIEEEYSSERFKNILSEELFDHKEDDFRDGYIEKIEKVVNKAREQKHGTMVVISDANTVEEELKSLKKQAILIDKMEIDPEYIKYLTSIDGAIYVDTCGKCHAIGVILDGEANENIGDASRGSRYNSAYKYFNKLRKNGKKCVVVVISEDGTVDIIPEIDNENNKIMLTCEIIDLIRQGRNNSNEFNEKEKMFEEYNCRILDYELYFKIAYEFYKRNNYEKAYDYYNKGLNIAEKKKSFIANKYYFSIALTYSEVAYNEYKGEENKPDNVDKIKKKILKSIGYYKKIIDDCNKDNISVDPCVFNNLGVNYTRISDIEKNKDYYKIAIENYTQAINLCVDKDKPLYYENRGITYCLIEDYAHALDDYIQRIVVLDDDKEIDSTIEDIKDVLDKNNNLVESAIEFYEQKLKEAGKKENNQLVELLKQYLEKIHHVSDDVAAESKK